MKSKCSVRRSRSRASARIHRLGVLVVLLGCAATLAACGAGSTSSTSAHRSPSAAPQPAGTSLPGRTNDKGVDDVSAKVGPVHVQMQAGDYYFEPTFVVARPGSELVLSIRNVSSFQHSFTIDALGIDETLGPGEHATVDVTVPTRSPLVFYCRFHRALGMQGEITAKVSSATPAPT
jgi:plastocyanin